MTLAFNDIRFALRGLVRSPLVLDRRDPVAGAGDRRQYGDFHADRPDPAAQAAGRGARRARDALPAGRAQRQQHGPADALVSDVPGVSEARRAAGRGAVPPADRDVGQHRQPDRAARSRDGLRQLLLDARRARPRSGACSTRRKTIRSTRAIRSSCSATTTGSAASRAIPAWSARRSS